jgi:quercetin dioxygenase-like cupin family protein
VHHRVFVDDDGRTQFEPLDLSGLSAAAVSARCAFFTRPPGAVQDWHNADSPMFIITLSGEMEVEIEGGRRQRFGPGSVRLAEDTTGPGHLSRVIGDEPWQFVVLTLD